MAATIQKILKPTKYRAVDTSGSNNHGQIYSGRGLHFDAVGDRLDVNGTDMAEVLGDGKNLTIACWIYATNLSSGDWKTILGVKGNYAAGVWFNVKADGTISGSAAP